MPQRMYVVSRVSFSTLRKRIIAKIDSTPMATRMFPAISSITIATITGCTKSDEVNICE